MSGIARLRTQDETFGAAFKALLSRSETDSRNAEAVAREIIEDVRARGDAALLMWTERLDKRAARTVAELEVPAQALRAAFEGLARAEQEALREAAARIRTFHEHQVLVPHMQEDALGSRLGQKITALDRVGLYVPGGKAAYPSSVLMNAIPARIAGVGELVMMVPAPGAPPPLVLAAAHVAEVDRVFLAGGAQAIAALAYGTASVPRVDKIVGPGNAYVAAAKRLVFGKVAIDMIAGPSEVAIVCDGATDPSWIAYDLFAQAEHDEGAQALLFAPDEAFLGAVAREIDRLLPGMERRAIIEKALAGHGALIAVRDLDEALALVNEVAPEHLELSFDGAEAVLDRVRHAGAIFVGRHTAESLGDYCAGPNHVLPTSGTARFSSPLGVYDFQKRTSIVFCTPQGAAVLGKTASILARGEGLTAHARSAECRMHG
ncbi:histidinol dehydrogenase [Acidiferrobacter sp. SPIII_3]|uniref:histidinol dehydrogenase n=1 Tax=Acidiferrobacter sp. SPIII_3 TaxID=1281578 RepID=UPI000D72B03F|nr:histidinol dehydrogenase [Acidiferrobacter sp. SPIII_3]AWP22462.1 histidinol dehydrogenase [Acidiferrobacter sp. SPIII_3]